jgi:RNA polymerase-binding transcription factor
MNETQLKEYKSKLEQERTLITSEIKQAEAPVDFGDDIDHGDEETDRSEEVGNRIAVAQDLQNRLNEIDIALEKIRTGRYGVCEQCGAPIEPEVLDVDPESRFCRKDKAQ